MRDHQTIVTELCPVYAKCSRKERSYRHKEEEKDDVSIFCDAVSGMFRLLVFAISVRGCFALRQRTRQVLGIAFDYHMRADLVTDAIQTMTFEIPGSIWHSDQGKQYGALDEPSGDSYR